MAKMVVGHITNTTARTQKMSNLVIPWVLFCNPQLAHVGLYEVKTPLPLPPHTTPAHTDIAFLTRPDGLPYLPSLASL